MPRCLYLVLPLALYLGACQTKDSKKAPARQPGGNQEPKSGVPSFDGHIKPLLAQDCVSARCHAQGQQEPDLTTYSSVRKEAKAVLAAVKKGSMPKASSPWSAKNISLLAAWIDGGMPEKGKEDDAKGEDGGGDTPTYVSYVKSWLAKNCTSCHSKGGTAEESALDTYAGAYKFRDEILARIQDKNKPMPPKPKALPGQAVVSVIKAWVAAGAPESNDDDPDSGESGDRGRDTGGSSGGNTQSGDKVTYSGWVQLWLGKNCVTCHQPDKTAPDLSTYELAKAKAARIVARSQDRVRPMPPPPGELPLAADVDKLKRWVDQGSPR